MKRIILIFASLLVVSYTQAQKKAVTEIGEEVILYDDGTWKYQNEDQKLENIIPTNPNKFEKDKGSTFLLKSNKFNVGIYINSKKWSFKKAVNNEVAEYELQLKGEELFGMIITEKIEIPLELMKTIALENGKASATDIKIVKEEYRIVNGLKVLHLQMNGNVQGFKISYYGYYFSNGKGTIQFVTFTSQNLLDNYKSECDKILNGLIEIN